MVKICEELLLKNNYIYIVGAQSRAKAVSGYIKELYSNVTVVAYFADDSMENEDAINGVPVYLIDDLQEVNIFFPVLIATKGIYHEQIKRSLIRKGFCSIVPITPDIDTWFRNAYVKKVFLKNNKRFMRVDELKALDNTSNDETCLDACVYMARSVYDQPVKNAYVCPAYEKSIQVGAALTSERIEKGIFTDCEGDNISIKNRQYCELTGLYWIWKHASNDIIGLSHYRRHFILPDNWIRLMMDYDIDVILPVPAYIAPNIEKNYKERHDASDWEYLMEYLESYIPADYKVAKRIFGENLYLTCNMIIARRNVLEHLCEWLFPIIDAVTLHGGVKSDAYNNRYAGFISERLYTLFFEIYENEYKIAYADKMFIS